MNSASIAKQTKQFLNSGGSIQEIPNNIAVQKILTEKLEEDYTVPLSGADVYSAVCPVHIQIKRHTFKRGLK